MDDIYFYDFDLTPLYILSPETGYMFVNAKQELRGSGSCQLTFKDKELEKLVRAAPEGIIVRWRGFWGVVSDYNFTDLKDTLYGEHLNVVLYKAVIPKQTFDGNLEILIKSLISEFYPWLSFAAEQGVTYPSVTYEMTSYQNGDSIIKELCKRANVGYEVFIEGRAFKFRLITPGKNPLMLSENNLNAYEFTEDFDGKTVAFGGWYEEEQAEGEPVWKYIKTADKTGIHKQDIVLKAKNKADAESELEGSIGTRKLSCKTKNISYGIDYKLGDIVRIQSDATVTRTVTAIERYLENGAYRENPAFEELEG